MFGKVSKEHSYNSLSMSEFQADKLRDYIEHYTGGIVTKEHNTFTGLFHLEVKNLSISDISIIQDFEDELDYDAFFA
jgi:hypothetical protein